MWFYIVLPLVIGVCYGSILSLEVGRNYNHVGKQTLDFMPRTIQEAEQLGFNQFGNCTDNPKFNGIPFKRDNDFALVVLFDVTGVAAGFQITILKSSLITSDVLRKPFILDGDRYILTVYFMDPTIICTTGAPRSESGSYRVFLQLDDSPLSSIEISPDVKSLDLNKWRQGDCVKFLGKHYWFKAEEPTSCEVDSPFFLVYDSRGQLFSFGHALLVNKQFVSSTANDILTKMFYKSAVPCLNTPSLLDMVYIFINRKWVPDLCLL